MARNEKSKLVAHNEAPAPERPSSGKKGKGSMADVEAKHGARPVDRVAVERKAAKTHMDDAFMAGHKVTQRKPVVAPPVDPPPSLGGALTDADAEADLAGTPRPDHPSQQAATEPIVTEGSTDDEGVEVIGRNAPRRSKKGGK